MKAALGILLIALVASSILLAQETATPEIPVTETPTEQPTETPTDLPTSTPTELPTHTPTELPTQEATLGVTAEVTVELPEEALATLFAIPTLEIATLEATSTESLVPITLVGVVRYQNRAGHLEEIRVTAYDEVGQVIALAEMGIDGRFQIEIPYTQTYHLLMTAPLHQTLHYISTDLPDPLAIILPGGDLDGDGCVLTDDLTLLTSLYETTYPTADINADGIVDVSDLSILAGNLQEVCAPWSPTVLEPTLEATPTEEIGYWATPDVNETIDAIIVLTPQLSPSETSRAIDGMDRSGEEFLATMTSQALPTATNTSYAEFEETATPTPLSNIPNKLSDLPTLTTTPILPRTTLTPTPVIYIPNNMSDLATFTYTPMFIAPVAATPASSDGG